MADRFINDDGKEVEISSAVQFLRLIEEGVIEPDTLVFDEEETRWVRAGNLPGFPGASEDGMAVRDLETSLARQTDSNPDDRSMPRGNVYGHSEGRSQDPARQSEGDDSSPEFAEVHPWRRYWARFVDIFLAGVLGAFILPVVNPDYYLNTEGSEYMAGMVGLLVWIGAEAGFLRVWGTTPGKKLMNIRIVAAGSSGLSFGKGFARSFFVWLRGLGCGIPFVTMVTMIVGYNTLTKNGISSWDEELDIRVLHGKVGVGRWILLFGLIFIFFFLSVAARMSQV